MPIAVITGSSSGIGQQTAIELARRGYSIVLHARNNLTGLQQTALQIKQANSSLELRCITADISCAQSCRQLVSAAFAWKEQVQVWVNNAGADVLTTVVKEQSFEQRLATLWNVDVAGTVRLSRLVADRMRGQTSGLPSIINVGWDQSWLGMEGEPGQLFCTAKSAITAFTRALALSVAPDVRVNCVAPGWIQTAWGQGAAGEYWNQRARAESLLNRWGTPQDVAKAIGWLADDEAQFVNGQCIAVNGGRRFYPS